MDFFKKNWLIIAIVIAVIAAIYWFMTKKTDTPTDAAPPVDRLAELKADTNRVNHYMAFIKNDANWYKVVQEKAKKNKITDAEQLRRDALYMIEQDFRNGKLA